MCCVALRFLGLGVESAKQASEKQTTQRTKLDKQVKHKTKLNKPNKQNKQTNKQQKQTTKKHPTQQAKAWRIGSRKRGKIKTMELASATPKHPSMTP